MYLIGQNLAIFRQNSGKSPANLGKTVFSSFFLLVKIFFLRWLVGAQVPQYWMEDYAIQCPALY